MPRTTRRILSALVASLLLAALPALAAGSHAWGNYHWARTSNPFTLQVGDNVSGVWEAPLDTSVVDWSKSSVLDLAEVAGGTRPKPCKATTGRVEVCNARYGYTGWLGIAQIWISGGQHITKGIVKVNDSYFGSAPYNTSAWRNLVMCQEIGHTFGLAHQDEDFDNANLGTCMDYTSDPSTNQHPNQHDYAQLEDIYEHLDNTDTVGSAAQSGPAVAPSWGNLVRSSRDGSVSLFRLDLGGGRSIVTHVTWAF